MVAPLLVGVAAPQALPHQIHDLIVDVQHPEIPLNFCIKSFFLDIGGTLLVLAADAVVINVSAFLDFADQKAPFAAAGLDADATTHQPRESEGHSESL